MVGSITVISSEQNFENRAALAQNLADRVARGLSRAVTRQGHATLAVSGGTTPQLFFEHLSREEISWEKIIVTLVDERQVDETSPRSNARLVRQSLIQNKAAKARFVPMYRNEDVKALQPDVVVLGMGEDGHTASFFPGGDALSSALDANGKQSVIEINAPGAGEPRLTFTLPVLLKAKALCLHIEGAKKKAVLEKSISGTDAMEIPVRSVLHSAASVEIYWCP
jgi:6-phosphogluconolactonase